MARFENSPGLFGEGTGSSTNGMILCEWCGTVHNEAQGEEGNNGESVRWARFSGKQVCDCCFERLEEAVWAHMSEIVPWFERRIKAVKARTKRAERALGSVLKELG